MSLEKIIKQMYPFSCCVPHNTKLKTIRKWCKLNEITQFDVIRKDKITIVYFSEQDDMILASLYWAED
jgi:hypothetical protein